MSTFNPFEPPQAPLDDEVKPTGAEELPRDGLDAVSIEELATTATRLAMFVAMGWLTVGLLIAFAFAYSWGLQILIGLVLLLLFFFAGFTVAAFVMSFIVFKATGGNRGLTSLALSLGAPSIVMALLSFLFISQRS